MPLEWGYTMQKKQQINYRAKDYHNIIRIEIETTRNFKFEQKDSKNKIFDFNDVKKIKSKRQINSRRIHFIRKLLYF